MDEKNGKLFVTCSKKQHDRPMNGFGGWWAHAVDVLDNSGCLEPGRVDRG